MADDIREELARVICDVLDKHMDVPTPGEITKSDYLTADAVLASPVIARILAEESRSAQWAVWDEFEDQGVDRHALEHVARKYRIHDAPQSIHDRQENER